MSGILKNSIHATLTRIKLSEQSREYPGCKEDRADNERRGVQGLPPRKSRDYRVFLNGWKATFIPPGQTLRLVRSVKARPALLNDFICRAHDHIECCQIRFPGHKSLAHHPKRDIYALSSAPL